MSPLAPFRSTLARSALAALHLPEELATTIEQQIRIPEADHGDLALPCFELAKRADKSAPDAAGQVRDALLSNPTWESAEAAGPYVNVRFSAATLAAAVVPMSRTETYGTSQAGKGKTIVIDFSSPNIAKPLAFHHIRSTVIGAAIGRLHKAMGWQVRGINYLGDWGKQFGLLATGFANYGDPNLRADAKHLIEVYVRANREADVQALQAVIDAPKKAIDDVQALQNAADNLGSLEGKALKKAERRVKSLQKRLRAARGQAENDDALQDLDGWYQALNARAEQAAAELPAVEAKDQEARIFLKRMEDGDEAALAEWTEFRETSIDAFKKVYDRMGVAFESIEGESCYTDVLDATVERVSEKPGTRADDGALVVDMPYKAGEPPVLLKTRDGTTLYVTRDIAAAVDRYERFAFDRSLYVVAADQSLHFRQLFATLAAMGHAFSERCHHITFGRVHGMSTRRGNVVFLDEVLDEAVGKARDICQASAKIDAADFEETVEAIGVGAVIFGDLKNLRNSDYTFRWEDVVNFDGFTGPYVQYTHARACSILRKAGGAPENAEIERLTLPEERALIMALARFPDAVENACEAFEPSYLTRCLLDIAQASAHYLSAGNRDRGKRILVETEALQAARLQLVDAVRNVLRQGLQMLGIKAPQAM